MHSNGSSIGKSSPPAYGGGGLPPMQHPLQVDFSPPEPYKPTHNIHEIENKEAEIERLQRELYDAQVCNYRLNAQMGKLVAKDWKREESELKVSFKNRKKKIVL
uniref:Uncharacterized protein n=1 Tax=Panagrolaimus sp. ES5 TaxID=591445 RepID=A0AC34FGI4_9BILA